MAINNDGSTGDASALLDVKSATKGALFPRMTKVQKNAIASPATGLLVFQTGPDSAGFHYYDGSNWLWLEPLENKVWKTTGNTGTDTAVNFIGTADAMPLRFRQNNIRLANLDLNAGTYFIGEAAGAKKLSFTQHSIAIGDSALSETGDPISTGTSNYNIAIGYKALRKHYSQIGNIAIGAFAMQNYVSNPGGNFGSVAIGYQAQLTSRTGEGNVSIGAFANINDTGTAINTAVGYQSMPSRVSGNLNTALGGLSGFALRAGTKNTFLGYGTNVITDSVVNATAIGANALVDTSNAMVLGSVIGLNGATANVNVAIGISKPKGALHIFRGSSGFTGSIPANRHLIVEDDGSHFIHLRTPDAFETGIEAGNSSSLIRAGVIFRADSAVHFRSGGNFTRAVLDKNGRMGIGTTAPNGMLHVFKSASGNTTVFSGASDNRTLILESSNSSFLQMLNGDFADAGIFSGNSLTFARCGQVFRADSSLEFFAGGNRSPVTSMYLDNNGQLGVGTAFPAAKIQVEGNFKLGINGSVNSAVIKDTVSIDVPSVAAGADVNVDVALAGVTSNGAVSISPAADLPNGIIISWARVTATGTVRIHYRNTTASGIDPAAINYFISVVQ